jgi:hypothetical protein
VPRTPLFKGLFDGSLGVSGGCCGRWFVGGGGVGRAGFNAPSTLVGQWGLLDESPEVV